MVETPAAVVVDEPAAAPPRPPDAPDRAGPAAAALAHPVFRPRRLARALTGLLLLGCLVLTGLLAWTTYLAAGQASVVPVLVAAGLTAAVWAARATTTTAYLEVSGGVLVVTRAGRTWRADLTSPLTGIEVVGRPGRPGWRVRFGRPGEATDVVDAAMVDPRHFMRVLVHHRPELAPGAPGAPGGEPQDRAVGSVGLGPTT